MNFDVLILTDFRFPGGTSTSIIADVKALNASGYSVGLISLTSPIFATAKKPHSGIHALVQAGLAQFVPPHVPVFAKLSLLHHPSVFEILPATPLNITCAQTILVVHHPLVDAFGTRQYKLQTIIGITEQLFGNVIWAPVGPKVRSSFANAVNPPPLTETDWVNIIDHVELASKSTKLPSAQPVIGRHSRPDPTKWPDDADTFKDAYPDAHDVRVRLMGWSDALDCLVEDRPSNWDVLPFGAIDVPDFLASLDYFSYFHSEEWIEAFGRSILEAMAAGLVCFLPDHFAELFEDAAIYCEPKDVLDHVRRLQADPTAYEAQSKRAFAFATSHFGPQKVVERVYDLIGAPGPAKAPAQPKQKNGVLYLTSNGVGMGHITRCLATARRLTDDCQPVIITMSKAFDVARSQGINIEFLPFFRSIGLDHSEWTTKLAAELNIVFRYHRPNVFVFDGNVPYLPLINVLSHFPNMWKVWQRRALWPPGVGEHALAQANHFDLVLEPGELAGPVDRGPTVKRRHDALTVPNIRFLDHNEALSRTAARELIGIDPDRPALLMQLGAGNNFDIAKLMDIICECGDPDLVKNPFQIVQARWRISENVQNLPDFVHVLDAFPISRFLNAFDCSVALAGYNTFHENIAAALPTLFTGNEHPEQDEQWLRAEYAALRGFALSARADDHPQIRRELRRLLDTETRDRLRMACRTHAPENGALQAASHLSFLATTHKKSALQFLADGPWSV